MLAQNFKTPADLGLEAREFEALFKVLGMLERGEIAPKDFAMDSICCGTVACIKGWCQQVSGDSWLFYGCWDSSNPLDLRPANLNYLFGYYGTAAQDGATANQAAIALRNYLTFGEPRWAEAMSDVGLSGG